MSKQLIEENPMKRKSNITTSSKILASAILMSGFVAFALHSALAAKTDAAAAPQVKQKEFDTPQQAADSLVQAAESFDVPVLKEILGPDSTDLVTSADPVEDKNRAIAFVTKAKEKNSVATDPKNPNRAILTVPLALREQEVDREIDTLDRRVLLASMLFALLGAGIGYYMAERIGDPVNRLTRATRRIARGDFSARVMETSSDELRRLVADFNQMASEVSPATPWTAPHAGEWDVQTVAKWAADNLHTDEARDLAALAVRGVYGEEGTRAGLESEYRWYVDPLDGTTNFAHGFPAFCVILGLERRAAGLAADAGPLHLRLLHAER